MVNHLSKDGTYPKKIRIKKNSGNKTPAYFERKGLYVRISGDDGDLWSDGLMLDECDEVSYPDGVQDDDGRIYIIYDRLRYD